MVYCQVTWCTDCRTGLFLQLLPAPLLSLLLVLLLSVLLLNLLLLLLPHQVRFHPDKVPSTASLLERVRSEEISKILNGWDISRLQ
jgi:hypothetical protein